MSAATIVDHELDDASSCFVPSGTLDYRPGSAPWPVLTTVDPARSDAELSIEELGSRIVGMAGRVAAATCRWLLLVAQFDRRQGWRQFGLWSTARWLSHHAGIARRTAVEQVRVARALAAFPQLAEEMAAGRLSYSQVRAISRLPRDGEDGLVADLIRVAQHGSAAQLEVMLRGVKTADQLTHGGRPDEEYLRIGWTATAQRRVSARLDAEGGEVVKRALDELGRVEQLSTAQALVRMAEIALAGLGDGTSNTRTLRGDERAAIVVHIDADTYPAGEGDDPADVPSRSAPSDPAPRSAERVPAVRSAERDDRPVGRIATGPGLPRRVVERLACAARVRVFVHDGQGSPLDVGRTRRLVTDRQFRALLQRDGGCVFPGCGSTRGLQAHHVRPWLEGGPTTLANLVLVCAGHHHLVHDEEFYLEPVGRQRWRFVRADGHDLLAVVRPADYADSTEPIEHEQHTDPTAPTSRWDGDRLDHDFAISVIAERRADTELAGTGQGRLLTPWVARSG